MKRVNKKLIKKLNEGDEKAFKILYDSYFTYLCSCAYSYIYNYEDSQDVTNNIFIKVWLNRKSLTYPIHYYLVRSVRNGCLNHIRSLRNKESFLDEYKAELLAFQEDMCLTDNTPIKFVEQKELEQKVKEAINTLPTKCQYIFKEYLFSHFTPKEIAQKNDISINTVRVHIKNALDSLRDKLKNNYGFLIFYLF